MQPSESTEKINDILIGAACHKSPYFVRNAAISLSKCSDFSISLICNSCRPRSPFVKRVDITSIFSGPKGLRRKGAANQPYALFAIKYATARFFILCRAAFAARKAGQLNIRELGAGCCAI